MRFLLHIVFPVRWLRELFHNHESFPTISVSREGGKEEGREEKYALVI